MGAGNAAFSVHGADRILYLPLPSDESDFDGSVHRNALQPSPAYFHRVPADNIRNDGELHRTRGRGEILSLFLQYSGLYRYLRIQSFLLHAADRERTASLYSDYLARRKACTDRDGLYSRADVLSDLCDLLSLFPDGILMVQGSRAAAQQSCSGRKFSESVRCSESP